MSAENFFRKFHFFELHDVFRTCSITISGYNFFFRWFLKIRIFKIQNLQSLIYKRDCSTSPSGGNQVDGSPPAPSMPSSKSGAWQSNGSDFSKPDHYYWQTWIFFKASLVLEVSSLTLSLWETLVSDFDRRVFLKKWKIDFWDIFWNYAKL